MRSVRNKNSTLNELIIILFFSYIIVTLVCNQAFVFFFILKQRNLIFRDEQVDKKKIYEKASLHGCKIWMHRSGETKSEMWCHFMMEYSLKAFKRAATVGLTTLRKDLRVDSVIARNWTTPFLRPFRCWRNDGVARVTWWSECGTVFPFRYFVPLNGKCVDW